MRINRVDFTGFVKWGCGKGGDRVRDLDALNASLVRPGHRKMGAPALSGLSQGIKKQLKWGAASK